MTDDLAGGVASRHLTDGPTGGEHPQAALGMKPAAGAPEHLEQVLEDRVARIVEAVVEFNAAALAELARR